MSKRVFRIPVPLFIFCGVLWYPSLPPFRLYLLMGCLLLVAFPVVTDVAANREKQSQRTEWRHFDNGEMSHEIALCTCLALWPWSVLQHIAVARGAK